MDSSVRGAEIPGPSEEDVRDYAFHLYQQRGRVPGRDLDDWLEAAACLKANRSDNVRYHPAFGP